ncbi:MAG: hypothetical protein HUJ70_13715 [Pseudobutyrivibrio sp.]|nr:hypothetical protein [Pseudobutyrivibrio sp.]
MKMTLIIIVFILMVAFLAGMLVLCTSLFGMKNSNKAYRDQLEEFVTNMVRMDKRYSSQMRKINKNMGKINFFLRTGNEEPEFEEREAPKNSMEIAALNLALEREKKIMDQACIVNEEAKNQRNHEFHVSNMKPEPLDITSMDFRYFMEEGADQIMFCANENALELKKYQYAIYFTTMMPGRLPKDYPHKRDGATLRSIYDHPSMAIWFLTNWRQIREQLEKVETISADVTNALSDFNI